MRRLLRSTGPVLAIAVIVGGGAAFAAWVGVQPGSASAHATTVGAGAEPVAATSGASVTLSWPAAQLGEGTPVGGYTVARFDAGGARQAPAGDCSGIVAATSCIDAGVPPGSWTYAVTPVRGGWAGAEGPRSDPVVITGGGGSLTLSSTIFGAVPATLGGTVDAFQPGETVGFRLDDPWTGTPLTGSVVPPTIPATGSAAISVTIPSGTGEGPHTVYAVGSLGSQAGAGVLRDATAPAIAGATIQKMSGGTAGWIRPGGSFAVYANAADGGAPPAGFGSVTADVSSIVPGQTAVPLLAGSWTVGAVTYGFRSGPLTAGSAIAAGPTSFGITATDAAANGASASFLASVDATAPTVSALIVQQASGGAVGVLAQGRTYYAYATATDIGGSGLEAVTADVSSLTAGQTAAAMAAGSWAVGGITYTYRSSLLTADAVVPEGTRSIAATAQDGAGNVGLRSGSVVVDDTAPVVGATVVQKSTGGSVGFLRQGASFYVYAAVVEAGGSGSVTTTADVSTVIAGQTAVPLTPGSWTVGGVTYNARSSLLTAGTPLADGARVVTISAVDGAANQGTGSAVVTVDNVAPSGVDVQTANAPGGVAGQPGTGDSITYTFSEPIDPNSISAGWSGTALSVVVRFQNGGGPNGDSVTIWDATETTQLPLGSVALVENYMSGQRRFTGSTMTLSGDTITVTFGTPTGAFAIGTATGTMRWTPSATATDRAGNGCATTQVFESGAADREF